MLVLILVEAYPPQVLAGGVGISDRRLTPLDSSFIPIIGSTYSYMLRTKAICRERSKVR